MAERVEWLRAAARGTWSELGEPYTTFRDGVVACDQGTRPRHGRVLAFRRHQRRDRCVHGDDRLVIRHLDNCSITVVDVEATAG